MTDLSRHASRLSAAVLAIALGLCTARVASASPQTVGPPEPAASTAQAVAAPAGAAMDDDRDPVATEPDFRIVNLPTTLRLPRHGGSFELTHRFNGNLRGRSLADNASDLFGLDDGATVGFEFRYGIARHVEAAVYRTNLNKTVLFYGKVDAIHQRPGTPLSLSAVVSIEGSDNFHDDYQPGVSFVVSRSIGSRLALYAEPTLVGRTGLSAGVDRGTIFVGLGARARVRRRMYVVAEISPRLSGYAPGPAEYGFGIEERVGGHVFQLNFTNTTATTPGQLARGGLPTRLFMGFNLTRKFF